MTGWPAKQPSAARAAIGRDLGVTADTVLRAMRLHNIPVRFATAPRKQHSPGTGRPGMAERTVRTANRRRDRRQRGCRHVNGRSPLWNDTASGLLDAHAKRHARMPRELDDPDWLRQRYATRTGAQIAAELGVSIATVHNTMRRLGIEADGPWVRRDITRLQRPSDRQLAKVWEANGTIRSISQAFGVAHTTAAVWLADAGIFVNDVPASPGAILLLTSPPVTRSRRSPSGIMSPTARS